MICYSSLNELITKDARSQKLFHQLSKEVQVQLQEQRQDICCHEDLSKIADGLQKRAH